MEQPLPCLFSSKRWANLYGNFINQGCHGPTLPVMTKECGPWSFWDIAHPVARAGEDALARDAYGHLQLFLV